jgi:NodT family efflux transporter outer membrane factor (OMF) lipoprotein
MMVSFAVGCTVGPDYVRPPVAVPATYKEQGESWKSAEPRPADSRQPWWEAYRDPILNRLMQDAERANQTLRQAEAQYRQARAVAAAARAALWPTVDADAGAQRARTLTNGPNVGNSYTIGIAASWEPDLWGGVRRSIESGEAGAQASADDLAAAHLSIQAELAQDYLQLRITDQQSELYAATTAAYARALALTQAQHAAGVALLSDVALAESQLTSAQAQAVDLEDQRSQLEHAIAILTGRPPADLTLAAASAEHPFDVVPPAPPGGVPSQLLERRPDIAAAERRTAEANEQIGIARAAYFPSVNLSAAVGLESTAISSLFNKSSFIYALGPLIGETFFDGGRRHGLSDQAYAFYDRATADYRQSVLTAYQQVEDNLVALRVLADEANQQRLATSSAQESERIFNNRYVGGVDTYLQVITAQTTALNNERNDIDILRRRMDATVLLIKVLGGGWDRTQLPPQ